MDELVRWLGEQLGEDERTVRAVGYDRIETGEYLWGSRYLILQREDGESKVTTELSDELALQIAEWDPARVLREIDAKRELLRDLEQAEFTLSTAATGTPPHDLRTGAVTALRRAVRLQASIYDQRPGYREEWRP
jgi:hypothetical protein